MKIVLQNVINSKVNVNNKEVANINKGLLLLVSFTIGDDIETCQKMAHKIANLRCFLDENYKTNKRRNIKNGIIEFLAGNKGKEEW